MKYDSGGGSVPKTSVSDALWHGSNLYATSLRAVCDAKRIAFPKGSIRRGQSRDIGTVRTPFGIIELSVHKDGFADQSIEHNQYFGRLHHGNCEEVVGRCFFSTYRPVRGSGWLSDDCLFYHMDDISQEACEFHVVLSDDDEDSFEMVFNLEGMLTADEIWISQELRGSAAWKVLYFCTMSAVFAHQRRLYTRFVFKAHPLIVHNAPNRPSKEELQQQSKLLRRFYAAHLGAHVIQNNGSPTEYMRAKVPCELLDAWKATTRSL